LEKFNRNDELTEIVVERAADSPLQTTGAQDATPVESQRLWERQAEREHDWAVAEDRVGCAERGSG
jgi:hypothetical protein